MQKYDMWCHDAILIWYDMSWHSSHYIVVFGSFLGCFFGRWTVLRARGARWVRVPGGHVWRRRHEQLGFEFHKAKEPRQKKRIRRRRWASNQRSKLSKIIEMTRWDWWDPVQTYQGLAIWIDSITVNGSFKDTWERDCEIIVYYLIYFLAVSSTKHFEKYEQSRHASPRIASS